MRGGETYAKYAVRRTLTGMALIGMFVVFGAVVAPGGGAPDGGYASRAATGEAVFEMVDTVVAAQETIESVKLAHLSEGRLLSAMANFLDGARYFEEGEYEQAIAAYGQAITWHPGFALAYYERGRAYRLSGQFEAALGDLSAAISHAPEYSPAYVQRGWVYADQGDYAQGLADANRAIALNSRSAEAFLLRGVASFHTNEGWDQAISDYGRAITLDPSLYAAYYNRAILFFAQDDTHEAIRDFDQAIALRPNSAQLYYLRANAHAHLNQEQEAIADYTEAIDLDPDFAMAYRNRGSLYLPHRPGLDGEGVKDCTLAIADIERYFELEPNVDERESFERELYTFCGP